MVASGIVIKEAFFINFQEKKFMNKILENMVYQLDMIHFKVPDGQLKSCNLGCLIKQDQRYSDPKAHIHNGWKIIGQNIYRKNLRFVEKICSKKMSKSSSKTIVKTFIKNFRNLCKKIVRKNRQKIS